MTLNFKISEELVNRVFYQMLYDVGTITEQELQHVSKQKKMVLTKNELVEINEQLPRSINSMTDPLFEIIERAIEKGLSVNIFDYPKPTILRAV